MKKDLIEIYIDKNGEVDFGISGVMTELTFSQLNEVRQMIPVAIWCAEDMWRRYHQEESVKQEVLESPNTNHKP